MIQHTSRNSRRHRVLVVDDDPAMQTVFSEVLDGERFEIRGATEAGAGLREIEDWHPDLIVLDQTLPDRAGLELLPEISTIDRHLPVLFMTSSQSSSTAIEAIKLGAFDYLTKPVCLARLSDHVNQGIENRRLLRTPVVMNRSETDDQHNGADHMIGDCHAMQSVYKAIGHLAAYDIPVLIQGEPGTGKRLAARAIHAHGRRSQQVLRTLRCSDYDSATIERELFGCDRTGQEGLLATCHGGTLILEEIADLPLAAQSSLLLHMHGQAKVAREGANGANCYDVTLIFTTAHDIDQLVTTRRVRSDLFYELSGSIISLPALRDREQDVVLLVEHYVQNLLSIRSSEPDATVRVSDAAIEIIASYQWPGNIAELKSVLRRALMESRGTVLASEYLRRALAEPNRATASTLPPRAAQAIPSGQNDSLAPVDQESTVINGPIAQLEESVYWRAFVGAHEGAREGTLYGNAVERLEKGLLSATLEATQGNLAQAARRLGMTRVSLRKKIQKLELAVPGRVSQE